MRVASVVLCVLIGCASQSASIDVEQRLHQIVQTWVGTPYRHGGSSLRGTDCSGFTRAVMAEEFGVELPRRSRDQALVGRAVAIGELAPGDLLFFDLRKDGKGIDHVGLYTGGGVFVHASPRRGVSLDRLELPLYQRAFRGARRVI